MSIGDGTPAHFTMYQYFSRNGYPCVILMQATRVDLRAKTEALATMERQRVQYEAMAKSKQQVELSSLDGFRWNSISRSLYLFSWLRPLTLNGLTVLGGVLWSVKLRWRLLWYLRHPRAFLPAHPCELHFLIYQKGFEPRASRC